MPEGTSRVSCTMTATLAVLGMLASACSAASFQTGDEGRNPSVVPAQLHAEYQLFATRCSKCHSLAKPLDSGIADDGTWDRVVERMRRQPGSGLTASDASAILRFLSWYSKDPQRLGSGSTSIASSNGL